MTHSLPFSSAIVVTGQRSAADRLRQQLNQIGIPFVHTPTEVVKGEDLLKNDEEAILLVDCDELGGISHQLLEGLTCQPHNRLRSIVLLIDDSVPELHSFALEFEFSVSLTSDASFDELSACIQQLAQSSLASAIAREKYRAARFLRAAKQIRDAENILIELLDLLPECSAIAVELAEVFREQARCEEALALLREAVEAKDSDLPSWHGLALTYQQKHRRARVIETLKKALSLNPSHSLRTCLLAEVYLAEDEWEEAAECFESALKIQESNQQALFGLLRSHLLLGRYQQIGTYLERIDDLALLASMCNSLAFELLKNGQSERAITVLNFSLLALKDQPQLFAKVAFNIGVIFHKQGDLRAALALFGLAAVIDPQFEKAKANWQVAENSPLLPVIPEDSQAAILSLLTGEPFAINENWPLVDPRAFAAQQNP